MKKNKKILIAILAAAAILITGFKIVIFAKEHKEKAVYTDEFGGTYLLEEGKIRYIPEDSKEGVNIYVTPVPR